MYPNRTMCQALGEMRECFKTYHFAPMAGLIEEVQSMGNRMEAALGDKFDAERYRTEAKELERRRDKLQDRVNELEAAEED